MIFMEQNSLAPHGVTAFLHDPYGIINPYVIMSEG